MSRLLKWTIKQSTIWHCTVFKNSCQTPFKQYTKQFSVFRVLKNKNTFIIFKTISWSSSKTSMVPFYHSNLILYYSYLLTHTSQNWWNNIHISFIKYFIYKYQPTSIQHFVCIIQSIWFSSLSSENKRKKGKIDSTVTTQVLN